MIIIIQNQRILCGTLLFVICVLSAKSANAQLLQNLLIGNPKAIALGNAVTADPPGIDSIHFNPAGLSRLQGRQMHIKFFAADVELTGEFSSNNEYNRLLDEHNEVDPIADTTSTVDGFAFYSPFGGITEVPVTAGVLGGASYSPPDSKFVFATAVYAPLIGGYIRDEDDPGRYYGKEAAVSRLTFLSPTFSYEVSPNLTVGAGIGLSYFGAGLTVDFRAPNMALGGVKDITDAACAGEDNGIVFEGEIPIDLCGGKVGPFETLLTLDVSMEKALSFTYNVGFLWEATPWLTIGGVYQSEAVDKLEGDVLIVIDENLLGFTQGLADSNSIFKELVQTLELTENDSIIETKGNLVFTLPAHAALGFSLQLSPSVKFNLDWKWTQTSKFDELTFNIDDPIPLLGLLGDVGIDNVSATSLTIPRGYEDAMNFAYGIEYQYSDTTAIRFGYEPRKTGIPKNKLDFLIPVGDFDLYGFGISYKLGKESILDISLAYMKSEINVPAGSSTNGNDLRPDNFIYNPSAGMDVNATLVVTILEIGYRTQF
ncbi:MAG: outer membrane protein transport protein [Pseudomonadales bacterium]|nr:outer membrane protein transport protein [Pseudomonadales bacterium]